MDNKSYSHKTNPGPRVLKISDRNPKVATVVIEREPLGANVTFLPAIIQGIGITARHFFRNVLAREETETVEYPEVKRKYPPRYRGLHRLMHRADGSVRCVACMMCPTVCPARCITIVPGEREDANEKYPVVFEIDELRCVACGLCVEACPCDAIRMDTGIHNIPVEARGDAVLAKADLFTRGGPSTATQGGTGGEWRNPESAVPAAPR